MTFFSVGNNEKPVNIYGCTHDYKLSFLVSTLIYFILAMEANGNFIALRRQIEANDEYHSFIGKITTYVIKGS